MNKRQNKKKIKYVIDNIQKVNLDEGEFLVFQYDKEKYRFQDIAEMAEYIKKGLTTKVIFLPSDFKMKKVKDRTEVAGFLQY